MLPPPHEIFLPWLKQTMLSKYFKETRKKNTEFFKTTVFHLQSQYGKSGLLLLIGEQKG